VRAVEAVDGDPRVGRCNAHDKHHDRQKEAEP